MSIPGEDSWAAVKDLSSGSLKKIPIKDIKCITSGKRLKDFSPTSYQDFTSKAVYAWKRRASDGVLKLVRIKILHLRPSSTDIDEMLKKGQVKNPSSKKFPIEFYSEYTLAEEKSESRSSKKKKKLPSKSDNCHIVEKYLKAEQRASAGSAAANDSSSSKDAIDIPQESSLAALSTVSKIKDAGKVETSMAKEKPSDLLSKTSNSDSSHIVEKYLQAEQRASAGSAAANDSSSSKDAFEIPQERPSTLSTVSKIKEAGKVETSLAKEKPSDLLSKNLSSAPRNSYNCHIIEKVSGNTVESEEENEDAGEDAQEPTADSKQGEFHERIETSDSDQSETNNIGQSGYKRHAEVSDQERSSKKVRWDDLADDSVCPAEYLETNILADSASRVVVQEGGSSTTSCCCQSLMETVQVMAANVNFIMDAIIPQWTQNTLNSIAERKWPISNAVDLDKRHSPPVAIPDNMIYCGKEAKLIAVEAVERIIKSDLYTVRLKVSLLLNLMFSPNNLATYWLRQNKKETEKLSGVLFPEDSRHAIRNLINIGFEMDGTEEQYRKTESYKDISNHISKIISDLRCSSKAKPASAEPSDSKMT